MTFRTLIKLGECVFLLILIPIMIFVSCSGIREREYYSHKENYVEAKGTVEHIAYDVESEALYLAFSDLTPRFSDVNFKIVGDNLTIVKENGIDDKLELGDEVYFISAPRYFGDGYTMPIVGITVDGEELLEFEDGFENLQKWLR